jgi:hypothetical protein
MIYDEKLRYYLDNRAFLKEVADMQATVRDLTGTDPEECGMITFKYNDTCIVNPFYDISFRNTVSAVVSYGDVFLNSDWMDIQKVNAAYDKFKPQLEELLAEHNLLLEDH